MCFLGFGGFGGLAGAAARPSADAASEAAYGQMEVLARALNHIESRAATQPSVELLVQAAIRGMLREIDNSSRYLTAAEVVGLEQASEVGELGLGLEASAQGLVVLSIQEASPAHKAGIRKGDALLAVEGLPVQGLSAAQVQSQLVGPVGSQAVLKLQREGVFQPLYFRLRRAVLRRSPLETHWVDSIWVIRLSRFSPGVALELSQRFAEALTQKPSSLVLDLRGNLGGLLQEAFGVASLFLPPLSPIVYIQSPKLGPSRLEKTTSPPEGTATRLPLWVLMDENSASVTEVLIAALKDNGRARLLGEKTHGKGSIQEQLLLPDGSAIYLTVAYFIRLTGAKIDKEGILPDCHFHQAKGCTGLENWPSKLKKSMGFGEGIPKP
ncbi:MAG: S41 family peptidase [Cystobacterineae bacterium]|nr:S41 family peptidase [Cystobacterineae bacterium]